MSKPMTAAQTVAQLKKWGVTYREVPGWRTRNRAGHGDWGPVFGCVTHHTGDDAPDTADQKVIVEGRSDLPGPLAQFGLNDDGTLDLIGCGRANHAGGGDPKVLAAVENESYNVYPPHPHEHEGSAGAVDGNTHFYGCETYYSGGHAMTAPQYATLVLLWAAICDFHGWSAKSVIGHKEWSDWKSDPGSLDMKHLRAGVQAALDAGPTARVGIPLERKPAKGGTKPAPVPGKPAAPVTRGAKIDHAIADLTDSPRWRAKAARRLLLGIPTHKKG